MALFDNYLTSRSGNPSQATGQQEPQGLMGSYMRRRKQPGMPGQEGQNPWAGMFGQRKMQQPMQGADAGQSLYEQPRRIQQNPMFSQAPATQTTVPGAAPTPSFMGGYDPNMGVQTTNTIGQLENAGYNVNDKGMITTDANGNKIDKDFQRSVTQMKDNPYGIFQIDPRFQFDNLPNATEADPNAMVNRFADYFNQGNQTFASGIEGVDSARNQLNEIYGNALAGRDTRLAKENQYLNKSAMREEQALDPTLGAGSEDYLQQGDTARTNLTNQIYGASGPEQEALARSMSSDLAAADETGLGRSTTGVSLMSKLINDFQNKKLLANQTDFEKTRAEQTAERNRTADFARQFSGQAAQVGLSQAQLGDKLLDTSNASAKAGGDLSAAEAQLGTQRDALGNELAKTAQAQRIAEAQTQMDEKAMQTNLIKDYLAIMQGRKQQRFNNEMTKEQMALAEQMANQGFWSSLFGSAMGGAGTALQGSFAKGGAFAGA